MIKKPLLWREITVPNSPSLSDIEPLYQAIQRLVACKGRNLEERARTDEKLQQALTARKRLLNEDVGT